MMNVKVTDRHGFVLLSWKDENGIPHVMRFPLDKLTEEMQLEILDSVHHILESSLCGV